MKLIKNLSIVIIAILSVVLTAQPVYAQTTQSRSSAGKKQTRTEFNESIFKMYKDHKQALKDLQIQFINKQFSQDMENAKGIAELRNKINPSMNPEKSKEILATIEKKNKDFQEKTKKDTDEFYSKVFTEKNKAFYEKIGKLSREFEETQLPVKQGAPAQPAPQQSK